MEVFVLKIIGIVCVTLLAIIIVISRKDDIDVLAILIATIFELIAIFMIYVPVESVSLILGTVKMFQHGF